MSHLYKEIKNCKKIVFDNNINKLYVVKNKQGLYNYTLKKKNTLKILEEGLYTLDEVFEKSKNYYVCYIDENCFDIKEDKYDFF